MFPWKIIASVQIASLFLIPLQNEASISTSIANSTTTLSAILYPTATVNGSTLAVVNSMTNTVVVATCTSAIQPTSVSKTHTELSSSVVVPSTSPPPSAGAEQAVVLTVRDMNTNQFEEKKISFISTVKAAVESYCSMRDCAKVKRKRRATTVDQVYIVPGYPQSESSGDLLVAVFVSTGENTFLSKNVLVTIVQKFNGNLSSALDREITGVERLKILDKIQTTESSGGMSGNSMVLYILIGGIAGVVLILAMCVFVTCWIGRKSEKEDEVRPITTSNLELVENRGRP